LVKSQWQALASANNYLVIDLRRSKRNWGSRNTSPFS